MPSPYTLVIIDMQPVFQAANWPDVVIGVTKEILAAIKNKASIMIVEYHDRGPIHDGLLKLVRGYPNKARTKKKLDDGSEKVLATLKRRKFPKRLRVCGVNASCCVAATIDGILGLDDTIKIEVIKDACGCAVEGHEWSKWYIKHENLRLV